MSQSIVTDPFIVAILDLINLSGDHRSDWLACLKGHVDELPQAQRDEYQEIVGDLQDVAEEWQAAIPKAVPKCSLVFLIKHMGNYPATPEHIAVCDRAFDVVLQELASAGKAGNSPEFIHVMSLLVEYELSNRNSKGDRNMRGVQEVLARQIPRLALLGGEAGAELAEEVNGWLDTYGLPPLLKITVGLVKITVGLEDNKDDSSSSDEEGPNGENSDEEDDEQDEVGSNGENSGR